MFVTVKVGEGGLFYTTNVFDESRPNAFGFIKADNFVTHGKPKRQRKEVKLWHYSSKFGLHISILP